MKRNKLKSITFLAILFLLLGCNNKENGIIIGVVQYANQSILDSVYYGINQEFSKYGEKYRIEYYVAHGDPILNATIGSQLAKSTPELIIALGTPSAQVIAKNTETIPLVFSAITDPIGAKLANTMANPGGNKTGITNMQPFEKQIELIKILKPNVKKVGIIINMAEANCVAGMIYVRQALERNQIPYEELDASTSAEIITGAQSLAQRCDVFFISPSNTLYENLGALKKEADKRNIMIVGGDQSAVQKIGSIGTYTYDFVEMGKNTAELAIEILEKKLNPGSIPVSRPKNSYLYINIESAKELGVAIPDSIIAKSVK